MGRRRASCPAPSAASPRKQHSGFRQCGAGRIVRVRGARAGAKDASQLEEQRHTARTRQPARAGDKAKMAIPCWHLGWQPSRAAEKPQYALLPLQLREAFLRWTDPGRCLSMTDCIRDCDSSDHLATPHHFAVGHSPSPIPLALPSLKLILRLDHHRLVGIFTLLTQHAASSTDTVDTSHVLLAIIAPDSTLVYYTVSKDMVKPVN
ncbi:hypothetical protein L1887_60192 [Cichorium endivia]|nr:hypothetical protein L1887_60192 [Cichorium endivia]